LVGLAAEAATCPAGTVTGVCQSSASREGAFRLLENPAVRPSAVRAPVFDATGRRCAPHGLVFVAVDGSVLSIADEAKAKGLGNVGSRRLSGVQVMSALAVTAGGTVLGLCDQRSWVRDQRSAHALRRRASPNAPSETRHWVDTLESSKNLLSRLATDCEPWFQLDRGADCWQVFDWAVQRGALATVRATHDRRVDDRTDFLWSAVEKTPVLAKLRIVVPARPSVQRRKRIGNRRRLAWFTQPRPERIARLSVRAATVSLSLTDSSRRLFSLRLNAVLVREQRAPNDDDKVEWMLLTTHPISTRSDVLQVVRGYSLRWRIEDFHRVWKRGLCRVEDTQLRSRSAIDKWATLLAAVATRAMRLCHLARSTPGAPASQELCRTEILAVLALRQPKDVSVDQVFSLSQIVRWIADIGGYTGPWNGPPGPKVIGRGLERVLVAADAFESLAKMR